MSNLALTKISPRNMMAEAYGSEADSGPNFSWVLHTLRKRRWWILAPAFLVPLAVMAFVLRMPDEYTSSAVFALIQPQVSKQYVDQMNSGSSSEMIRAVTRQVLAVPRLSGIVDSFGLFASERGQLTSEQLGEKLREQIGVAPVDQANPRADFTAFRLSFTADNAKLAQQVLSQLSSLFIEVNLKERGSQAQTTTAFLKSQMDVAKQRMDRQEQVLLTAKMGNASSNPAVNQAKLGVMSDLRMQLQNATTSLSRLAQQKVSVESTLNANLARLQNDRTAMLKIYTAKHPEILKKEKEIATVQGVVNALRKNGTMPPAEALTDPVLGQLANQIETNAAEYERIEKEAHTLREEINRYQAGMLSVSPVREHEMERAQKDYDLMKQEYDEWQQKYFRSQVTANLEEEQSGQNFRLVDPPTLPAMPSGPKRLKISLAGIGGGLLLGLLLAFAVEFRYQTFLREADLRKTFQGALVIGIPVLSTPKELRNRKTRLAVEFVVGGIMVAVVSAAEYYIFLHG